MIKAPTMPTMPCAPTCLVASGCSPAQVRPCVRMASAYARKQDLCDRLEAIADSLPFRVDRLECVRVATVLLPFLREMHGYEEDVLFPAFERGLTASSASGSTVRRLKSEHLQDECAAEEITEQLLWIGRGGETGNPEALGFMLRAFFDPVRRHIAFEREHVIPAAGPAKPGSDSESVAEPRARSIDG